MFYRCRHAKTMQRMVPQRMIPQRMVLGGLALACALSCAPAAPAQDTRENEVVANLAGGRVIAHVSQEMISFAVIDHPVEKNSAPPRVMSLDGTHVGILFGAGEWQVSAEPKPVRLDHNFERVSKLDPRYQSYPDDTAPDLESVGIGFLERLRPLVGQLHTKLN